MRDAFCPDVIENVCSPKHPSSWHAVLRRPQSFIYTVPGFQHSRLDTIPGEQYGK
jgi:hypothetical protein